MRVNERLLADRASALHRPRGRIRLDLFDEAPYEVSIERTEHTGANRFHSLGRLERAAGSHVLLAVDGNVLAGTVLIPGEGTFQIGYAGDGLHRIVEPDPARTPGCAVDQDPRDAAAPVAEGRLPGWHPADLAGGPGLADPTDPVVVDVLVLYTEAAREAAGGPAGIQTLIDLAVAEAHLCYVNSGVRLRLNVVYQGPVHYPQEGALSVDLERLTQPDDGFLDEAHTLRAEYAADLVCLIVEEEFSRLYAGKANQRGPGPAGLAASAFSVVRRAYLTGNFTFAHELGHNLGCGHDRANAASSPSHSFAYGYRFVVDDCTYRTVMAYRPGLQIPYFSNPDLTFLGVPLGVPAGEVNAADNARALNENAAAVAAFGSSDTRLAFTGDRFPLAEPVTVVGLTIRRTGLVDRPASVRYATRDESARTGIDYLEQHGRVVFGPGETESRLSIMLVPEVVRAWPKTFQVALSAPQGAALAHPSIATVVLPAAGPPAAGSLDPSFDPGTGVDHAVRALAVGSDGAVVLGGSFLSVDGVARWRVARLRPGGALDEGFVPAPGAKYAVHALALRSDGRVLIAGEFNAVNGTDRGHLARLEADGALDPGFTPDAAVDLGIESGANDFVYAVLEQPDGKVVAGGRFTAVNRVACPRLARFEPDGALDAGFAVGAGPDAPVRALALQPDGRLLLGGEFGRVQGVLCPRVARLDANGAVDAEFRPGSGANDAVHALALATDGKVLLAGAFTQVQGVNRGGIARLHADGSLDDTFDPGAGANGTVCALAVEPGGRILLGGAFTAVDGVARSGVARLESNGALDTSFNAGCGANDRVVALGLQPDGQVLIGGMFTEVDGVRRRGIARLLGHRPSAPGVIRLSALERPQNGVFHLVTTNSAGNACVLEASTNLVHWWPVLTNRPSGDSFEYLDPEAGEVSQRFFRAREAEGPAPVRASTNRL